MQCVPYRVEEVLCPAVCERIELLESWKAGHTGFSAHNAVTVQADDGGGLERLARYLLRPPLSPEHLERTGSAPARAPPRLAPAPEALVS